MAKHLFITRLSEFGTNDLIVANQYGHVIDVLQHACRGIDHPLTLDHVLYEGKVYRLDTPPRRRRLSDDLKGQRDPKLIPVKLVDIEDISGCLNDRSANSVRATEFLKQHFDLKEGMQ